MSSAIIIDNGAHSIKGGFAGAFEPEFVFPTQIARKKFDDEHSQVFCGHDVSKHIEKTRVFDVSAANEFEICKPLADHENVDWEALERLWKYLMYDKLKLDKIRAGHDIEGDNQTNVDEKERISAYNQINLLLSSYPTDTIKYKSKLMELGYETFDADGIYISTTTALGLYSIGELTGTVVDSGYNQTFVSSIYEGYTMPFNNEVSKFGGATIDQFLQTIILQNPRHLAKLTQSSEHQHQAVDLNNLVSLSECEKMKKKYCYVAQDFYEEETMYNNRQNSSTFGGNEYQLPDGSVLNIRNEKYQACELLFQPKLANLASEDGISELVYTSISKCSVNMQRQMFSHIVLTGGNTMLPGFTQRLDHGVTHYAPASMKVMIKASPQRHFAAFSGASILASQQQMTDVWITRDMYEEMGNQALLVRCF